MSPGRRQSILSTGIGLRGEILPLFSLLQIKTSLEVLMHSSSTAPLELQRSLTSLFTSTESFQKDVGYTDIDVCKVSFSDCALKH